jgi:hypothetical protein
MYRLVGVGLAVLAFAACEVEDPCAEYVDYMCECHPEVDCDELRNTYADPDPELQEQCTIDLDAQRDSDEADGICQTGSDTDTGA